MQHDYFDAYLFELLCRVNRIPTRTDMLWML